MKRSAITVAHLREAAFWHILTGGPWLLLIVLSVVLGVFVAMQSTEPLQAAGRGSGLNTPVVPGDVTILSEGTITDLSSAVSVPDIPATALVVCVQAQGGNIRICPAGGTPTATSGGIIYAGTWYTHNGNPLSTLKLIQESDADAFYFYHN